MEEETQNPANTIETGRNPDGTWKPGFSGNPNGRPRQPLKDYSLKEFDSWTDEQKKEFLAKISPIDRWKMTEGNPAQDLTSKGEHIFPQPIMDVLPKDNGNQKDNRPVQEN